MLCLSAALLQQQVLLSLHWPLEVTDMPFPTSSRLSWTCRVAGFLRSRLKRALRGATCATTWRQCWMNRRAEFCWRFIGALQMATWRSRASCRAAS
jgi:hypothetical protein